MGSAFREDFVSLDVYLRVRTGSDTAPLGERIFVRRDGQTVEVTRAEWDEMYPDREPVVLAAVEDEDDGYTTVFDANITHNMGRMARECGDLYAALWRPDEKGWTHARDLIGPLRDGLAILQTDFDRLQEFNPANGWGNYDGLVRFTAGYLAACERWPDAEVSVWR